MKVSIIIPNWNGMKWLSACLESVYAQSFTDFSVVVVDNASQDQSVEWLNMNYPQVHLLQFKSNRGFSKAVNEGINYLSSSYYMLLNTDTVLEKDCLKLLVKELDEVSDEIGAISPLMVSLSDPSKIDDAGDLLSWYGAASKKGHGVPREGYDFPLEIFSPSGGASIYRKTFFDRVGYFDERFFAYLEDVDLGFRGRLFGFRYRLLNEAIVYHQGHGSQIAHAFYIELVTRNRILLFLKNAPFALLVKHSGQLLYGQLFFLLAYGHLMSSLRGYLGAFRQLPSILKSRRQIQSSRVISNTDVDVLLGTDRPAEGIWFHLRKLWQ